MHRALIGLTCVVNQTEMPFGRERRVRGWQAGGLGPLIGSGGLAQVSDSGPGPPS